MSLEAILSSELEHHGVKGMKWGVRKKRKGNGVSSSRRRELSTIKDLPKVSKLSEDDIRKKTERYRNENELKRLTKGINPKKRKEYYKRASLSDSELKKRVERLRLEDTLKREIKNTNRDNIKTVNKLIKETSKFAVKKYIQNGNFSPTGNSTADLILKESLKYVSKQDKIVKWSDNMELDELLSMTPSELEHHGVKGMKWGVRKGKSGKVNLEVKSTENTRYHDKRDQNYRNTPGLAALLVYGLGKSGDKKRANKVIESTLNISVKDIDKKDLKDARKLILEYDNFEIKTSNSDKWNKVN